MDDGTDRARVSRSSSHALSDLLTHSPSRLSLLSLPSQSELGDVVYVELPEVGSQVTKGEAFGVVESVKSASDVYSPVDGEVVEVNGALADDPAKLNADAFGGGWMMKVKVGGAGATDGLLDAAAYKKSVGA